MTKEEYTKLQDRINGLLMVLHNNDDMKNKTLTLQRLVALRDALSQAVVVVDIMKKKYNAFKFGDGRRNYENYN